MGRKSCDDELQVKLPLIISMFEQGLTDKEIAEKLDISYSTWKRKKAQNNEIKEALEKLKDTRNQEVEEALFKCCKGYHYWEEVATKIKEEFEGEEGQILVRESVKISNVKKYKGPDLAAQKYWLNNKKKSQWKDDPHRVEVAKKELKIKEENHKANKILGEI